MRPALALLLVSLLAGAVLWGVLWGGLLPPAWDPRAPLDVQAPSNALLGVKLRLLRADASLCRAALATAGLRTSPVPDSPPRNGCGLTDAVHVASGEVGFEPASFVASCPLAVRWALFEFHALQPAAREHLGRPVTRIGHLGSYACRDVRGGTQRSSHATADALDVASFTLQGGRRITLAEWDRPGEAGAFLRDLRDRACKVFATVLSPDYDAAHADHFHLQATGWGACR